MDVLLTPVVNRFLRRFIKKAAGEETSQLRVSLSRGSVALHNLELNLDELTARLPVTVKRAYARQLTISVPWISFVAQPLQVTLDTIEVILVLNSDQSLESQAPLASEGSKDAGRFGSLTSLLLRTLFDTKVVVKNVVVKYESPGTVATFTCHSILAASAVDNWRSDYKEPQDWLKKVLDVQNPALSLVGRSSDNSAPAFQIPILHTTSVQVAVTVPVFAILDPQRRMSAAPAFQARIESSIAWLDAQLTDRQLQWLAVFAASLVSIVRQAPGAAASSISELHSQASSTSVACSERDGTVTPPPRRQRRPAGQAPAARRRSAAGMGWLYSAAMAAVSDVWDYVIDEAAVAEAAPQLAASTPSIDVSISAQLAGGRLLCGLVERMPPQASSQCRASPASGIASHLPYRPLTPQHAKPWQPAAWVPTTPPPLPLPPDAAAALERMKLGVQHEQAGVAPASRSATPAIPQHVFAFLQLHSLSVAADIVGQKAQAVNLSLDSLSVQRRVSDKMLPEGSMLRHAEEWAADEMVGLYPFADTETPALQPENASSAALSARWQQSGDGAQSAHVQAGQVAFTHAAGFAACLWRFVQPAFIPASLLAHEPAEDRLVDRTEDRVADSASSSPLAAAADALPSDSRRREPPLGGRLAAALQGSLSVSASAGLVQLTCLSGTGASASAVMLSVDRLSARLGAIRAASRPGSLAALLFDKIREALPDQGFRASILGLQLGAATAWESRGSSAAGLPACMTWFTNCIEIQGIAAAAAGQQSVHTHSRTGAQVAVDLVSSAVQAHMQAAHVAAAVGVMDAVAAEACRHFQRALPHRSSPARQQGQPVQAAWLSALAFEAGGLRLNCAPASSGGADQAPRIALQLGSVVVAALCNGQAFKQQAVACMLPQLTAVASQGSMDIAAPAADMRIGDVGSSPASWSLHGMPLLAPIRTGSSAEVHATHGPRAFSPCSATQLHADASVAVASHLHITIAQPPPAGSGEAAEPGRSAGMQLSFSLQQVAVVLMPRQAALLAGLGAEAAARPALPPLLSYPPAVLAAGPCSSVDVSVSNMSWQLTAGREPAEAAASSGLAGHVLDLDCHIRYILTWDPGTSLDALGFPAQTPVMHMTVDAATAEVEINVTCPGPPARLYSCLRIADSLQEEGAQAGLHASLTSVQGGFGTANALRATIGVADVSLLAAPAPLATAVSVLLPAMPDVPHSTPPAKHYKQGAAVRARVTVRSLQASLESAHARQGQQQLLQLSTADCVLSLHTAARADAQLFPGPQQPAALAGHLDVLLFGVMVELRSNGERVAMVLPADWHVAATACAGCCQVGLDVACLLVQVSGEGLAAAHSLTSELSQGLQEVLQPGSPGSQTSAGVQQAPGSLFRDAWADDLRCGLFAILPEPTQNPGPMEVSWGQESVGLWSSHTEAWLTWRYPFPRAVLLLHTAAALPDLHLGACAEGQDSFAVVQLLAESDSDGPEAQGCTVSVQGALPAELWQLRWRVPAGSPALEAAAVVRTTLVNAGRARLPLRPLAAPWALRLEVEHAAAALLGRRHAEAPQLEELATCCLRRLQASVHVWPGEAISAFISTSLRLELADAASLTIQTLLSGSTCSVLLMHASRAVPEYSADERQHTGKCTQDASSFMDPSNMPLPSQMQTGTSVSLRSSQEPLSIHLSELGMQEVQRLLTLLAPASKRLHPGDLQPDTWTGRAPRQPRSQPAASLEEHNPMKIENCCPLDLGFGQAGTQEVLHLAPGACAGYCWRQGPMPGSPACRRLQLCGHGPAPAAQQHAPSMCAAFDAMAPGMHRRDVVWPGGLTGTVVVCVNMEDLQWRIRVRPGHAVSNGTGRLLCVCYIGPVLAPALPGSLQGPGADARPGLLRSEVVMELHPCPAGENPRPAEFLALRAGEGAHPQGRVQVWLGGGGGWSLPLALSGSQCQAVAAGGFSREMPASPMAQQPAMPRMMCCVADPHPTMQQTVLQLRSALSLHSGMTCALRWQIQQPQHRLGSGGAFTGSIQPGQQCPLDATCDLQEALMLQLEAHAAPADAAQSSPEPRGGMPPAVQPGHRHSWSWRVPPPRPPADVPAAPPDGWSVGWATSAAAEQDASFQGEEGSAVKGLPKTGQHQNIVLAWHGQVLPCILSAHQPEPDCPCLTLDVRPHSVLRNGTAHVMTLEAGALRVAAAPGMHVPFSWQPMQQRPRTAVLAMRARTCEGFLIGLRTQCFALNPGTELQLDCSSQAVAGTSPTWEESISFPIALQVFAEGFSSLKPSKSPSSLILSVTAGVSVTNITPWLLVLTPTPVLDQEFLPALLQPGTAARLQPIWRMQRAPSRRSSQQDGSLQPALQIAASTMASLSSGSGSRPVRVPLGQPSPRCRALLELPDGSTALLTHRVLTSRLGHLHLILFVDCQPPLTIHNLWEQAIEVRVSLDASEPRPSAAPLPIVTVPAQGHLDLDPWRTSAGGQADNEDEDAFLQCISGSKEPVAPAKASMQLRQLGTHTWSEPCALLPGHHRAGLVQWTVEHVAACSCVTVAAAAMQGPTEAQAGPAPMPTLTLGGRVAPVQPGVDRPLCLHLHLQELQVSLWDDERRRWRGVASSKTLPSSMAELFVLSLRDLSLAMHRGSSSVQRRHVDLEAYVGAMQMDSHLQGSSCPVVCASLAPRAPPAAAVTDAPFISMQVQQHAVHGGHASLTNTWVEHCSVELLPLLVSLDNPFVAFMERTMHLLMPQLPSPQEAARAEEGQQAGMPAIVDKPGNDTKALTGSAHLQAQDRHADWVNLSSAEQATRVLSAAEHRRLAEAATAAAPRLLIQRMRISRLRLVCEVHISAGAAGLPVGIDTHRAPVVLPSLQGSRLLFRVPVMAQALIAHLAAEALLNGPRVLGSLDLLFNPVGLLTSVSQGLQDMLALPLAAIEARSASQFAAGLGLGGASMLRHLSAWTLTSVSGFSGAVASVLQHSLAAHASTRALAMRHPAPGQLQQGLSQGLAGLAGSVSAGVSGVYAAPAAAYREGTGMLAGTGRGLLGVVGLPLSGALDLVASLSAGLATSAGIDAAATLRRPAYDPEQLAVRHSQARLVQAFQSHAPGSTAAMRLGAGASMFWTEAVSVVLAAVHSSSSNSSGTYASPVAIPNPVLMLAWAQDAQPPISLVAVFGHGGRQLMAWLHLPDMEMVLQHGVKRLQMHGRATCVISGASMEDTYGAYLQTSAVLSRQAWLSWMPLLKIALNRA